MKVRFSHLRQGSWFVLALLLVAGGVGIAVPIWLPWVSTVAFPPTRQASTAAASGGGQTGRHHDHGHAGHAEEASIELSRSALQNIEFRPVTIEPTTFTRMLTMPAMVVERPGRSQIHVTAPLTGVVSKIFPIQGAAVGPAEPLFQIRLTHEELVGSQRELIRTAESLEVVKREIARLEELSEGVVAGRRILEQQYEQQKLEASLQAERQALLLHGLTEEQVQSIVRSGELFRLLTVRAPQHDDESESCRDEHLFHVQQLPVKLGEQVEIGQLLCVVADHCELYVEGSAFEDDAAQLREAARQGWDVAASLLVGRRETEIVEDLQFLYVADHIDAESRAFRFYLSLSNQVAFEKTVGGHQFIEWRFKPGQRMEVHVPVERWPDRIVLPIDAVVKEGAETYVYQQNGNHFDRVPVTVEYRDQNSVVVANDGSILPGDIVAGRGAYQMHLALKNKVSGGVDPHAGHDH